MDILDYTTGINCEFLVKSESPLTTETLQQCYAIISHAPKYNANSFKGVTILKYIRRFGVGYDMVGLAAYNDAGFVITITKGAVNYSVSE